MTVFKGILNKTRSGKASSPCVPHTTIACEEVPLSRKFRPHVVSECRMTFHNDIYACCHSSQTSYRVDASLSKPVLNYVSGKQVSENPQEKQERWWESSAVSHLDRRPFPRICYILLAKYSQVLDSSLLQPWRRSIFLFRELTSIHHLVLWLLAMLSWHINVTNYRS